MEETNLESSFIQCQVMVPQFFRVGVEGFEGPHCLLTTDKASNPKLPEPQRLEVWAFYGQLRES